MLDTAGHVLGTEAFSTTRAGYRALTRWLQPRDVRLVGIEGTGSYRCLPAAGVAPLDEPHRLLP